MTLTSEFYLEYAKVNHSAKYPDQRSFSSNVCLDIETYQTECSTWTTQWSVITIYYVGRKTNKIILRSNLRRKCANTITTHVVINKQ